MARSKAYAVRCSNCERLRRKDERFSYAGRCRDCSIKRATSQWDEATGQLESPDYVDRWARGLARSVRTIHAEKGPS